MDVATIDQQYQQLQQESAELGQTIQTLASKLQASGAAGNADAREWILDLKGIALQIQQEQLQVQALLQALHGFAVNTIQQMAPPPTEQYAQAPIAAPQQYAQAPMSAPQPHGGLLSHFMGSNFGQAMGSGMGMGAGFGLADSLISSIFH